MIDRYSRSPMKDLWTLEAQFEAWLEVELAVCEFYAKKKVIPAKEFDQIRKKARINVPRIAEIEADVRHDVIAFTTQLAEEIGPASRFVHLGLTSSDVVDTAWALRMAKAAAILKDDLKLVLASLKKLAKKHANTIMMGRTHGMHAEPTTFGLKCLIWFKEFERHGERLEAATRSVSVGKISGAVGTMAHTGPALEEFVCKKLKLGVEPAATQVVQRDRHAEFLSVLAQIGSSIEKIAVEIRHLQRPELREVEEPFGSRQKGSSAMPHKRNPVVAEQMTGLSRVLRGNALAAMENVALWHERDISHSSVERVIIPDSCTLLDYLLGKLQWMLDGMKVNSTRMEANIGLTRGLVFSQRMLLKLVDGGLTREDAYASVQAAAMRTWNDGDPFIDELLKEAPVTERFSAEDLQAMMDPHSYLAYVADIYARCGVPLPAAKKQPAKKTKK